MRRAAVKLAGWFLVVAWLAVAPTAGAAPTLAEVARWQANDRDRARKTAFLACQLSEAEIVELSTNLIAADHSGVFLIDSPNHSESVRNFLKEFRPSAVIAVGDPSGPAKDLGRRLQIDATGCAEVRALTAALFPKATKVVLAPATPRGQLLQAAVLAGTLKAPLCILSEKDDVDRLRELLRTWETREIHAVGGASAVARNFDDLKVIPLADEHAAATAALKQRAHHGPVPTLVIANPHKSATAMLAPWLALQKRGLLLLSDEAGGNVRELVDDATNSPEARHADALLLAGDTEALPTLRRPNPLEGKDEFIEAEPLTPTQLEPVSFATGRLFHKDPAIITLMVNRPRLWPKQTTHKAVIVSNPGGGLPLLETFSRNTALELKNGGFDVTAFFGADANRPAVRAALPDATIFLWEGHHSTLMREYEALRWAETLQPSLVFLQSCLALTEEVAHPFLERGAVAVVSSTSRNYSASGGALSLAYFDAMIYDRQTLGGSLRSAKNFLLAYTLLKEKRLGDNAKMNGASLRTALSFSLWGDPTLELPRPELPEDARAPIRHQVQGNTIVVSLPTHPHSKVITTRYHAQIFPNARLAGLISKKDDPDGQALVPLIFQEVSLPKAPEGKRPHLRTRLPDDHWVFCWDARRATVYLLIRPRAKDTGEIRFQIDWQ